MVVDDQRSRRRQEIDEQYCKHLHGAQHPRRLCGGPNGSGNRGVLTQEWVCKHGERPFAGLTTAWDIDAQQTTQNLIWLKHRMSDSPPPHSSRGLCLRLDCRNRSRK